MIDHVTSVAHRLAGIAEANGRTETATRINSAIAELEKTDITVGVLGEFKVGKSSLLNALLDTSLLPEGDQPLTNVVTEIRQGEALEIVVKEADSRRPLSSAEYQDVAAGRQPIPSDATIEMRLPSPALGGGLCFVDTPGVKSLHDHHDAVTYGYLPKLDAALLVIEAASGSVRASMLDFLDNHVLKSDLSRLRVVLSKCDKRPPGELESIRETVSSELQSRLPNSAVVFSSAKGQPGVGDVLRLVREDILPSRRDILSGKLRSKLIRVGDELAASLAAERGALGQSSGEIATRIEEVRQRRSEVLAERSRAAEQLRREFEALERDVETQLHSAFATISSRSEAELRRGKVTESMLEALSSKIRGWIGQEIDGVTRGVVEPRIRQLAEDFVVSPPAAPDGIVVSKGQRVIPETAIDLVVEAAILAALNFVLPGSWLVALLGRVVGAKGVELLKRKLVDVVRDVLGNFLGDQQRKTVLAEIQAQLTDVEGAVVTAMRQQLDLARKAIVDATTREFDARLAEQERALTSAQQELQKDAAARKSAQAKLAEHEEAVRTLIGDLEKRAAAA